MDGGIEGTDSRGQITEFRSLKGRAPRHLEKRIRGIGVRPTDEPFHEILCKPKKASVLNGNNLRLSHT